MSVKVAKMKCLRIFGGESVEQPTLSSPAEKAKKRGNLFLVKILLLDDQEIVQEISVSDSASTYTTMN
jgi:hypothetical protein